MSWTSVLTGTGLFGCSRGGRDSLEKYFMKRCMIGAALGIVALLLFAAPQVRADGVDKFTLTENLGGGNTLAVTWSLPASPTTGTAYPGAGIGFTAPLVTYTYSYDGS